MLNINETDKITKLMDGMYQHLELNNVEEKELLLSIAAKLHSIRGMLIFFTALTIIGFIIGLIIFLSPTSHTYRYPF